MIDRRETLQLAYAVALSSFSGISLGLSSAPETKSKPLIPPLFDELYYVGKPDLEAYGFSPIHVAYTWQLWGEQQFDGKIEHYPPIEALRTYRERYELVQEPPKMVILDIEHWKHYGNISEKKLRENIQKYITCIDALRETFPATTKFSLYNIGAQPNFGSLLRRELTEKEKARWQRSNDLTLPMVEKMDFLTPSLYFKENYTFAAWERRARYFLQESRRLGADKPVIPFIWPQYADTLPFRALDGETWQAILSYVVERSDGVVFWRRHKGPLASEWDPNAEWWNVTKQYIAEKTQKN